MTVFGGGGNRGRGGQPPHRPVFAPQATFSPPVVPPFRLFVPPSFVKDHRARLFDLIKKVKADPSAYTEEILKFFTKVDKTYGYRDYFDSFFDAINPEAYGFVDWLGETPELQEFKAGLMQVIKEIYSVLLTKATLDKFLVAKLKTTLIIRINQHKLTADEGLEFYRELFAAMTPDNYKLWITTPVHFEWPSAYRQIELTWLQENIFANLDSISLEEVKQWIPWLINLSIGGMTQANSVLAGLIEKLSLETFFSPTEKDIDIDIFIYLLHFDNNKYQKQLLENITFIEYIKSLHGDDLESFMSFIDAVAQETKDIELCIRLIKIKTNIVKDSNAVEFAIQNKTKFYQKDFLKLCGYTPSRFFNTVKEYADAIGETGGIPFLFQRAMVENNLNLVQFFLQDEEFKAWLISKPHVVDFSIADAKKIDTGIRLLVLKEFIPQCGDTVILRLLATVCHTPDGLKLFKSLSRELQYQITYFALESEHDLSLLADFLCTEGGIFTSDQLGLTFRLFLELNKFDNPSISEFFSNHIYDLLKLKVIDERLISKLLDLSITDEGRKLFANVKFPEPVMDKLFAMVDANIKYGRRDDDLLIKILKSKFTNIGYRIRRITQLALDEGNIPLLQACVSRPDFLAYIGMNTIEQMLQHRDATVKDMIRTRLQMAIDSSITEYPPRFSTDIQEMAKTMLVTRLLYEAKLEEEHPEMRPGNLQSSHVTEQKVILETKEVIKYLDGGNDKKEKIPVPDRDATLRRLRAIILARLCPLDFAEADMTENQRFIHEHRDQLISHGVLPMQSRAAFLEPDHIEQAAWRWLESFQNDFNADLLIPEQLETFYFDKEAIVTKRGVSDTLRYIVALLDDPNLDAKTRQDLEDNLVMQFYVNQREYAKPGELEGLRFGRDVSCMPGVLGRFFHVYESHPAFRLTQQEEVRNQARLIMLRLMKDKLQEVYDANINDPNIDVPAVKSQLCDVMELWTALGTYNETEVLDGTPDGKALPLQITEGTFTTEMLQQRNELFLKLYPDFDDFAKAVHAAMIKGRDEEHVKFKGNKKFAGFNEEDISFLHMLYFGVCDTVIKDQVRLEVYAVMEANLDKIIAERKLMMSISDALSPLTADTPRITDINVALMRRALEAMARHLCKVYDVSGIHDLPGFYIEFARKYLPATYTSAEGKIEFFAKFKENPLTITQLKAKFLDFVEQYKQKQAAKHDSHGTAPTVG